MRILFTRFPYESSFGGAEVQTLSLMEGLGQRGHEVAFLGSCPVLLERTRKVGIKNYELHIGKPPVTKWDAMTFLWRRHHMRRQLIGAISKLQTTNYSPQTLIMLSLSEKLLLTSWVATQGIQVLWIEHDRIGRWLKWNPWLPHLRRESHNAHIVLVSELSRTLYEELGFPRKSLTVICNGIDTKRLEQETFEGTPEKPKNSALHVGCVARLSEDKGVDLLLGAISNLPEITLDIVGDGRDVGHIQARAQEINREAPRIRIFPHLPSIGAFYRSLDLLVLPSRVHDPCPLAPMEAMALGVPVILTEACGVAGYVRNGTEAIVVPPNSVQGLEGAIRLFFDKEMRRRIGASGRERAKETFSMKAMVRSYTELLERYTHPNAVSAMARTRVSPPPIREDFRSHVHV